MPSQKLRPVQKSAPGLYWVYRICDEQSIDEHPLGSLELLSIAHNMHDLHFSCHTNRNNRAGRWKCVHSKAVCSTCAIGPIFTGADPPPLYIPRNSNTVCTFNPWFNLSFLIFDACCDGKIKF